MSKIDFENLAIEALDNIREDRSQTKDLLNDLVAWVTGSGDRHSQVANSLAKYVETLQRSNEQLVKIATTSQKQQKESIELDDEDRNALFEKVKQEQGSD